MAISKDFKVRNGLYVSSTATATTVNAVSGYWVGPTQVVNSMGYWVGNGAISGGSGSVPGESGYSGYSGQPGAVGLSGYSGTSGITGLSGYSGTSGATGLSGYSGISGATGVSTVAISETPPTPASSGNLWWNSSTSSGVLKIYYVDANTSQWVDAVPMSSTTTPGFEQQFLLMGA